MTYQQALNRLPSDADISTTFGYPGVGGYAEYHRTPDGRRFAVSNGNYDASAPFVWNVIEVD